MRKLFIRVFYDSNNIKNASIWKISLVSDKADMLYIETQHDNVSDSIPEGVYQQLLKDSYFKGLTGVDSNIGSLKMVDSVDGKETSDINIFINDDNKIREKINQFINTYYNSEEILYIFKDCYEYILFMNYMNISLDKVNYEVLNHYSLDNKCERYNDIINLSIENSLKELEGNDEIKSLFMYMRIVIETLILKDFFTYIFNNL